MFAQWSGMWERSIYSGKLLITQIRLSLWGGGVKGYFVFLQEKLPEVTKTHFEYNKTYISSLIENSRVVHKKTKPLRGEKANNGKQKCKPRD